MARAIKLIEAPIGLFEVDGILVLKTEYSTRHEDGTITPDCYIIESGEYFWGGVDSVEERNNLEVTPVDMPTLTPPNEPLTLDELREMKDKPAYLNFFDPLLESGWHIIKAVTEDKIIFRGWQTVYVPIDGMGVDYDLYRRPPEGEA